MTYCEKCRIKYGWPKRTLVWLATCRECGKRRRCYDTPMDELPGMDAESIRARIAALEAKRSGAS